MKSVAEILRAHKGGLDLAALIALAHLRRGWATVVGEKLGRRTFPYALKRDCLYVNTDSSAWVAELELIREPLLKRASTLAGRPLKELRCRIARLPATG
jgi:predicted nucleic acid-binding Zn ribbon protein